MTDAIHEQLSRLSSFKTDDIRWKRLRDDRFGYPIDYWIAVLGVDRDAGRIDFLAKWEPDSYCHFHRHNGRTMIAVLEGEHHVVETTPTETVHKTRKAGHVAHNPPGDVHMEYGGPQGAVVFFGMEAVGGKLFEVLDKEEKVLRALTLEDFAGGNY